MNKFNRNSLALAWILFFTSGIQLISSATEISLYDKLFGSEDGTLIPLAAQGSPELTEIKTMALLSDIHINRGTNRALFQQHLLTAIQAINAAKVDLVMVAGDLTEDGTESELREFRKHIRNFSAPVVYVPGNHDIGDKRLKTAKKPVTEQRLKNYEQCLGPTFYVKDIGGIRIVGFNSCLADSQLPEEAEMWKTIGQSPAPSNSKPTYVLLHHPPFTKKADEPGGVYWNLEPESRQRLLEWSKQNGVKAIFSGHLHNQLTNHYGDILLYTTGPIAYGLPKGKQPEGWTLITLTSGEPTVKFILLEPADVPQSSNSSK